MNMDRSRDALLLQRLAEQAESLLPQKWIDLESARLNFTMNLMDQCGEEETPNDILINDAIRRAGFILTQAFAAGTIPTRGIEHPPGEIPVLHEPLPSVWWHRVVEWGDEYDFEGDRDLPVHCLSWEMSQLSRVLLDAPERSRLAVVTDIEVELASLPERIAGGGALYPEIKRRRWNKRTARQATVRKLAKEVIRAKFGSVERFLEEVANAFSRQDEDGIETKTVGRYIFEE